MRDENIDRHRILKALYQAYVSGVTELERRELAKQLDLTVVETKRILTYLSDPRRELVTLSEFRPAGGSRIFHFARITPIGIDVFVEPQEFAVKHPDIHIAELIQVGDIVGASGIAVGNGAQATVEYSSPLAGTEGRALRYVQTILALLEQTCPQALDELVAKLLNSEEVDVELGRFVDAWLKRRR
jgi:hypothetical protein